MNADLGRDSCAGGHGYQRPVVRSAPGIQQRVLPPRADHGPVNLDRRLEEDGNADVRGGGEVRGARLCGVPSEREECFREDFFGFEMREVVGGYGGAELGLSVPRGGGRWTR